MRKKKYYISVAFMVLILAAVFMVLFKDQDLDEILHAVKSADFGYMILAAAAALLYVIMEGVSMDIILRSLGYLGKMLACIKYSFIGFFFNAVTPSASGGQPMQVLYMKEEGINMGEASVTLLFWTIIYKVVLVVVEGLIFIFYRDFAIQHINGFMWLFIVGLAVNVVSILLYSIIVFSENGAKNIAYFATWCLHKLRLVKHKEKIEKKLDGMIKAYQEGAVYMRTHLSTTIWVFLATLIQRISYFAITWFVYRAMGFDEYSAVQIIILQSFVAVCIDILPMPGGVGANEGFFVALFTPVMGHSISVSAMLLSRGAGFYALLLVSAAVVVYAQAQSIRRNYKKSRGKV